MVAAFDVGLKYRYLKGKWVETEEKGRVLNVR